MKNFTKYAILGASLMLGTVMPASATSTLTLIVSVQQIEAAFVAGTSAGAGNCLTGLTDCAIYAVGFGSDDQGVGTGTGSHGLGNGTATWGPTNWSSAQIAGNTNPNPAWEVSGPTDSFITYSTHTVGNTYTANTANANQTGAAPLSAGTTLSFLINYTTPPTVGLTDDIVLKITTVSLNSTTGAQITKALSGTVTVHAVVNADGTISSVPEPGTIALFGAGLAGICFSRFRRRRA